MTQEELGALRSFLDEEGRVTAYPSKRAKKTLVLRYLAEKIDPDRRYSEKEMNALLNAWHTFGDPCTLRRELYDCYLLERERDGSAYWANSVIIKEKINKLYLQL